MAERAKHAFGSSQNLMDAVQSGKVDAYDILFLDGDTDPKVGWVTKDGTPVVMKSTSELEGQVAELETELATKADAADVNTKINQAVTDTVATAKSYIDGKVDAALNEHMVKKYEITSKPEGTLVDYSDKEIRVLCPESTVWTRQNVGATGNANMVYMGFKAYAPEGAVGFKEGDKGVIIDEYFDFNGDFAGTDEFGRNYSICWLALASYNDETDTWTYFGKNSTTKKYIGWDYVVDWYDANGIVIESDSVRINLANEDCYSVNVPYYVGAMEKKIEEKIDEKIAEATAVEVIEF